MKKQNELLGGHLPNGWEAAAKTEGALVRSRQVKNLGHPRQAGAGLVLRLMTNAFTLYNDEG